MSGSGFPEGEVIDAFAALGRGGDLGRRIG
jgi:hypothetical protein